MSFLVFQSVHRPAPLRAKLFYAALLGLATTPAQAGFPTVYGKIFVSANAYDLQKNNFALTAANATSYQHTSASTSATELDSVAVESSGSRLGIQGDFGFDQGLSIFYRIEYGIDVDNGTNANGRELSQRNIFAGIRGGWGQVLIGKNDTPLKTLQTNSVLRSDIDRFNDYALADIGSYIAGENRADNVIQYSSPVLLGGLEINFAAIQAEETGVPVNANNQQDDNGFASGQSLGIYYGKAKWYVGLAYDNNVATADTLRALGEISLGPVKLAGIYQSAEQHEIQDVIGGLNASFIGSTPTSLGAQNGLNPLSEWDGAAGTAYKKQHATIFNAHWKIAGPWSVKGQIGQATSTPSAAFADVKTDAQALGVDYQLSDSAKLFTYYARLKTQGDRNINTLASLDKTYGAGLDFKF